MTLMERITADSMDLYEAAAAEPFLEELGRGTLDRTRFLDYIVQDSIYLRDYMKAFAMGMFRSRTLRDMQFFYSVLGFVNDSENATRLGYLADGGLTDDDVERMGKRKACSDYTGFLIQIAEKGSLEEILMAVMPCMTGYEYVFGRTLERHPEVLDTYYGPLVRDYTSPFYSECCREWESYCDKVCGDYPDKARLSSIFREAARHELMFWKMAGGEE